MKSGPSWTQGTHRDHRKGRCSLVLNPQWPPWCFQSLCTSSCSQKGWKKTWPNWSWSWGGSWAVWQWQKSGQESPDTQKHKHCCAERRQQTSPALTPGEDEASPALPPGRMESCVPLVCRRNTPPRYRPRHNVKQLGYLTTVWTGKKRHLLRQLWATHLVWESQRWKQFKLIIGSF